MTLIGKKQKNRKMRQKMWTSLVEKFGRKSKEAREKERDPLPEKEETHEIDLLHHRKIE
jgi:hypothetical protein